MYNNKNLFALAAAIAATTTTVTANPAPAPAPAAAAQPATGVQPNFPRQTDDNILSSILELANALDLTQCLPYALPLVSELPPIPSGLIGPDLISQGLSQTGITDVCDFTVTGTVGPIFTSFLPAAYTFFWEHDAAVSSIVSECTEAATISHMVENFETCGIGGITPEPSSYLTKSATEGSSGSQSFSTPVLTTSGSAAASSSTPPASSSAAPTTSTPGAAPPARQSGMAATAALAAGFIGAVAVL